MPASSSSSPWVLPTTPMQKNNSDSGKYVPMTWAPCPLTGKYVQMPTHVLPKNVPVLPKNVPAVVSSNKEPELSQHQRGVVDLVLRHKRSVFFTGSAGTGKSRTLREITREADQLSTRITAMTGIAASNLLGGASTVHSFAGIGLGKGPREKVLEAVKLNKPKVRLWKMCKLLVVDEASMMSKALFELLEFIARKIRGNEEPFGGIQLCLCGDFFQLPPVNKSGGDDGRFCFESPLWSTCVQQSIELTTVYRQHDESLLTLLGEVRYNECSQSSIDLLLKLNRPIVTRDGFEATKLFPTNNAVDRVNAERLAALPGEKVPYKALDHPNHSDVVTKLNASTMYPEFLELKLGAQVMKLNNAGDLVNGSRGVVEDWSVYGPEPHQRWPIVKWHNGSTGPVTPEEIKKDTPSGEIKRKQLPLKLAWAITIHKAQGMSIDLLEVDLARVFEKGQAYVALSRARTIEGLRICSFDPARFWTDARVVEFYKNSVRPVEAVLAEL